jgi:hypothetical protein
MNGILLIGSLGFSVVEILITAIPNDPINFKLNLDIKYGINGSLMLLIASHEKIFNKVRELHIQKFGKYNSGWQLYKK